MIYCIPLINDQNSFCEIRSLAICINIKAFNPYSPNVTFLYPLKMSENLGFPDVFKGYKNATLREYGLLELTENN